MSSTSVRVGWGLSLLALATISAATLSPAEVRQALPPCLWCGERALADFLSNIVLFFPLGLGLGLASVQLRKGILLALLLSSSVEAMQMIIPGRHPNLVDTVSNATGCALGVIIATQAHTFLNRWIRRRPFMVAGVWLALTSSLFVFGGLLMNRHLPADTTYFGQWTPNLGHLEWYRGRVLSAEVSGLRVGIGPLMNETDRLRSLMDPGPQVHVDFIAGPPPDGLASLFSIADSEARGLLLLGIDRDDVVVESFSLANELTLDSPEFRFSGMAAGFSAGDTLTMSTSWDVFERRVCIGILNREECRSFPTVTRVWSFLMFPSSLPDMLFDALDIVTVIVAAVPLILFLSSSPAAAGAASALLSGVIALGHLASPDLAAAGKLALIPLALFSVIIPIQRRYKSSV